MTLSQKTKNLIRLLKMLRRHFANLVTFDSRGAVIGPFVRIQGGERILLSDGVFVANFTTLMTCPAGAKTERDAFLRVGSGSYIGECVNIRAAGADINIGRDVMIANNTVIVSSNHGFASDRPISEQRYTDCEVSVDIGNGAWIGAGVSILAGVKVGAGAVIASGAVLTKSVGENEIWGGVPAKRLGFREATKNQKVGSEGQ
ncbi:acyltransferase [Roseibacillus ishigakijimensis]|uniref:Acyltransferase n=1 Tax=Roseibacillus ishigakijimensis TaxID=454146 RepID=A0A934VH02_9BACT|nr:acyltransferase [Roseibacillus ishigakijimensis]MBK1833418.1 acyltransferase [Roseibacillus ishigakijimensis]